MSVRTYCDCCKAEIYRDGSHLDISAFAPDSKKMISIFKYNDICKECAEWVMRGRTMDDGLSALGRDFR